MSAINGLAIINGLGIINGAAFINGHASSGVVAPGVPTGLTPTGGTGSIALAWNAVSGATSYNVAISSDGGSTYGAPINVGTNAYTDSTASAHFLATTGLVFYKVQAQNSAGTSAFTSAVSASPWAFYDNFTAPDGTLLSVHPLVIGPSSWTMSGTATFTILGNAAFSTTDNAGGNVAYINTGANDCTVYIKLPTAPTGPGYCGIAIRFQDVNNRYALIVNHGDAHWYLSQLVAGVGGNVEAVAGGPVQNGDILSVNCSGNNITAFVNGTQVYQYTSATQFHTVNNFGLFQNSHDTSGSFDDFRVTIP